MSGWLETLASKPSAGTPAIPPAVTRPRCKHAGCEEPWNGSHLLLCEHHEEEYLDFFADAQAEVEGEE